MGCNCSKKKPPVGAPPPPPASSATSQEFSTTVNGRTQSFGSKLERDAAVVRSGLHNSRRQ